MKNESVNYSSILYQFIEPMLHGSEDEEEFLAKAKIGMIAWNFNLSDLNELPSDQQTKKILKGVTERNERAKEIFNSLVIRKQTEFPEYNEFIIKVELEARADGSQDLFVETASPEKVMNYENKNLEDNKPKK